MCPRVRRDRVAERLDDMVLPIPGLSNRYHLLKQVDCKWNSFGKGKSSILIIIISEVLRALK